MDCTMPYKEETYSESTAFKCIPDCRDCELNIAGPFCLMYYIRGFQHTWALKSVEYLDEPTKEV